MKIESKRPDKFLRICAYTEVILGLITSIILFIPIVFIRGIWIGICVTWEMLSEEAIS